MKPYHQAMARYVLLRHDCPPGYEKPGHWDFMLEVGDVLWTWELRALPASWQRALGAAGIPEHDELNVTRLADHRRAYLDFEGPLSGDRGVVTRIAGGKFELLKTQALRVVVKLSGDFVGTVELAQTSHPDQWTMTIRT
jgi:hypothetical protein